MAAGLPCGGAYELSVVTPRGHGAADAEDHADRSGPHVPRGV